MGCTCVRRSERNRTDRHSRNGERLVKATASNLEGVTYAVTLDLADLKSPYTSVHNRQKQEVARRVALNVLATSYGQRAVNTGPVATAVRRGATQQQLLVRVASAVGVGTFRGSADCVKCCSESPFEIAAEATAAAPRAGAKAAAAAAAAAGGVSAPGATAAGSAASRSWTRVGFTAPVQSSGPGIDIPVNVGAARPTAVRYAYDADVQCVYFDRDGLPLAPFVLAVPQA